MPTFSRRLPKASRGNDDVLGAVDSYRAGASAWHWPVQGYLSSHADGFIAPSQAIIKKLEGFGPVPRPVVIPNGIDAKRFQNAERFSDAELPWPRDAWVVGYVGRLDPVKRLNMLLRAVSELVKQERTLGRKVHAAIVGYGEMEAELRREADRLMLGDAGEKRVHFIGATKVPERWMKSFNAFCSPSAAEGFGLTLVEASAAGLPVIACDTPAIRESLGEERSGYPPKLDARPGQRH